MTNPNSKLSPVSSQAIKSAQDKIMAILDDLYGHKHIDSATMDAALAVVDVLDAALTAPAPVLTPADDAHFAAVADERAAAPAALPAELCGYCNMRPAIKMELDLDGLPVAVCAVCQDAAAPGGAHANGAATLTAHLPTIITIGCAMSKNAHAAGVNSFRAIALALNKIAPRLLTGLRGNRRDRRACLRAGGHLQVSSERMYSVYHG